MQADGKAWLFVPDGLVDGPFPSHYEPEESPVANPLYRAASRIRYASSGQARTTRAHPSDGAARR